MVSVLHDGGAITDIPHVVFYPANENSPPLRLADTQRNHYGETFFNKECVFYTNNFAWLWVKYDEISLYGLVRPCHGEGANSKEIFSLFVQQNLTVLSMAFYKPCFVDGRKRDPTILQDFVRYWILDPHNSWSFSTPSHFSPFIIFLHCVHKFLPAELRNTPHFSSVFSSYSLRFHPGLHFPPLLVVLTHA